MTSRELVVAIHQPNYLPWMGYFSKIYLADVFVFIDDVALSKGSYTNRVKILGEGKERWLTQPVSVHLGDKINAVYPSKENWAKSHLSTLRGFYGKENSFRETWPRVGDILASVPNSNLAVINRYLVEAFVAELGFSSRFISSSEIPIGDVVSSDRLVEITRSISPTATYLSGKGAEKYQDENKFSEAGLGFSYTEFTPPTYKQGNPQFVPGLSTIDAILRLGWSATADLIAKAAV
jgi:hypothetical protein